MPGSYFPKASVPAVLAQKISSENARVCMPRSESRPCRSSSLKKVQAARSVARLSELVERGHSGLSLRKQCELLGISRSSLDYEPVGESAHDQHCKRLLDELYMKDPCLGTRRLPAVFKTDYGIVINRKRLQRLRREMGLEAMYRRPRTSVPASDHRVYPYLLRGLKVDRSDQVWCSDTTYVPMFRGNAYLCAVMDWHSRKVLGWRLSNTMDSRLCLEALEAALAGGDRPEIFNTDQGSQFTSQAWIERLEGQEIRVSMDGRGRWMDNVFIERLWRSVKYECIYLSGAVTIAEQSEKLQRWFERYHDWRPHQTLKNRTPSAVYEAEKEVMLIVGKT